jgi:hypothetical protein
MLIDQITIQAHLLQKAQQRGINKSLCPSEIARDLGGEAWRSLMDSVRQAGATLIETGDLVALQRNQPVDPWQAKGAIRFKITPQGASKAVNCSNLADK